MSGFGTWRNLQSVMIATLHVAVVASLLRALNRPTTLVGSYFLWVPLAILLALFLTGPISRAIVSVFDPDSTSAENRCPRCRQPELRPLIRPKAGMFQPVARYRCAACWTTFRRAEHSLIELGEWPRTGRVAATEIEFPVESAASEGEIRFLDDPDSA